MDQRAVTTILPTMPASKWPGIRQANSNVPGRLKVQTMSPRLLAGNAPGRLFGYCGWRPLGSFFVIFMRKSGRSQRQKGGCCYEFVYVFHMGETDFFQ